MTMKKRLLGVNGSGLKDIENQPTMIEMVQQEPSSVLCKILNLMQRQSDDKMTDDDL